MKSVSELEPARNSTGEHRDLMETLRLLLGLFGAPFAWTVQLALSEPLVARACYPKQAPLTAPTWEGWPVVVIAVSIACLGLALLSGVAALKSWRRQARKPLLRSNTTLRAASGRARFLIKLGLMSSFIFIVAVIFNISAVLLVPLCSSWY